MNWVQRLRARAVLKFYGVFLFWILGILWAWHAPQQPFEFNGIGALLRSKLADC